LLTKRQTFPIWISYVFASATSLLEIFTRIFGFVPVIDLSGQGLASAILHFVESLGLDLNKMVGQRYDGTAAIIGHLRNVQAVIRQQYSKALYVHFSVHSLNLVISSFCSFPAFKHLFGTLSRIYNFYSASTQNPKSESKRSTTSCRICENKT